MAREFDSPWKETLDRFLNQFLMLFFRRLHAAIDWSRGYESLDNELREIMRDAESGTRLADRLFRVYSHSGEDVWLLIHLEVQAQPDPQFEQRMFVSYYRIFDRYNRDVVSIAVFGDEQANWRPDKYRREAFGTGIVFRYLTIKLLDWAERKDELEESKNPIALIVLSHLESLATNQEPERRRQAKWQLIRRLYGLGWTREQFREVYRLIGWFLELPKDQQRELQNDISTYEKEVNMPYITSTERMAQAKGVRKGRKRGMQQGMQQGIEKGMQKELLDGIAEALELKFGHPGKVLAGELSAVSDLDKLREIRRAALQNAITIDQLRAMLQ